MAVSTGVHMNIFLIGYRCTGKTTIGKQLAEKIGWRFVDADAELVSDQGMSVAKFVSLQGWDEFRRIETAVLKNLCGSNQQVIATGGGVVLAPENIKLMKENGVVIWLKATAETIYSRMSMDEMTDEQRPALTDNKLWDEILETLAHRRSSYEAAMNGFVDTDNKTIASIIKEVMNALSEIGIKF